MHHWQDIAISIGQLVLAAALVPSILSKDKPSLWTSITCGVVLALFAFTYLTIALWYAAVTTFISALLWILLAAQKLLQTKD